MFSYEHHQHHHGGLFGGFIPNVLDLPFLVPHDGCPSNSNAAEFSPFPNNFFNSPYSVPTTYTAEAPLTIRVTPAPQREIPPVVPAQRRGERALRAFRYHIQKNIAKQKEAILAAEQRAADLEQNIRRLNQNQARQNATYDNHAAIIAYAQSLKQNAYNLLRKKLKSTQPLVNLPTSDLSKRGLPVGDDGKNLFQAIFENPNFTDSDKSDLFGDLLVRCNYNHYYRELFTHSLIHHLMKHVELLHTLYLQYGRRKLVAISAEIEEKIWLTLIKSARIQSVLTAEALEGIPDEKQDDTVDLDEEKPYNIGKLIIVFNALPEAKKNSFAKLCITHFLTQNIVDNLKAFYLDLLQNKNARFLQEHEKDIWKKLLNANPEIGFDISKAMVMRANYAKLELFQTLWIEQLIKTRNTVMLTRLYNTLLNSTLGPIAEKAEQLIWNSLIPASKTAGSQLLQQLRENKAGVSRMTQFAKSWLQSLNHRSAVFEAGVALKKDYPNNKRMRSVIDIITQDRLAAIDVAEEKGEVVPGQVRVSDEEKHADNNKQIEELLKTGKPGFFSCGASQHSYFSVHQKALKHSEDLSEAFEKARTEQEECLNRKLEKEIGKPTYFSLR